MDTVVQLVWGQSYLFQLNSFEHFRAITNILRCVFTTTLWQNIGRYASDMPESLLPPLNPSPIGPPASLHTKTTLLHTLLLLEWYSIPSRSKERRRRQSFDVPLMFPSDYSARDSAIRDSTVIQPGHFNNISAAKCTHLARTCLGRSLPHTRGTKQRVDLHLLQFSTSRLPCFLAFDFCRSAHQVASSS